jgi:lysylphosphatidylglycerol synthetase-like protein (DUF2156 family)
MKTIKKAIITISLFLLTAAAPAGLSLAAVNCDSPSLSAAEAIQCGTDHAAGQTGNNNPESTINGTVKTIINVLSVLVGITAVIMIIIAGFRYITSGGKQESITSAKNTLLYAVIGLVIVALAQVIVRFVLTTATNSNTNKKSSAGSSSATSSPPSSSGASLTK